MNIASGEPEMILALAVKAKVAQYLGLPIWGLAGATDSKTLDAQAGVESAFSLLAQRLAGLNLIHDIGYMDMAMVCSVEMLILGDEVAGMTKRFLKGIEVSEEQLASKVIHEVGPGGNFLAMEHTVNHFRRELWFPNLMTRLSYENWEADGAKNINRRIKEKLQEITTGHRIPSLSDNIFETFKRIKKDSEQEAEKLP